MALSPSRLQPKQPQIERLALHPFGKPREYKLLHITPKCSAPVYPSPLKGTEIQLKPQTHKNASHQSKINLQSLWFSQNEIGHNPDMSIASITIGGSP